MTPPECCQSCPVRQWGAGVDGRGRIMLCVDGVPVGLHWDADYCPHLDGPRFGTGTKPNRWDENPALAAVEVSEPQIPVEMLTDEERRGLGDVIKDGIHFLKLDVVMNRLRGAPDDAECSGCEARRRWLNRLASWKK